jgi:hypothetical protein
MHVKIVALDPNRTPSDPVNGEPIASPTYKLDAIKIACGSFHAQDSASCIFHIPPKPQIVPHPPAKMSDAIRTFFRAQRSLIVPTTESFGSNSTVGL